MDVKCITCSLKHMYICTPVRAHTQCITGIVHNHGLLVKAMHTFCTICVYVCISYLVMFQDNPKSTYGISNLAHSSSMPSIVIEGM